MFSGKVNSRMLNDGIFAVKWTLDHAVDVNPGGVNKPVRVAVLEQSGGKFVARMVSEEELQEHQQNILEAKASLVDFRNRHRPPENIPFIPKPDTPGKSDSGDVPITSLSLEEILKTSLPQPVKSDIPAQKRKSIVGRQLPTILLNNFDLGLNMAIFSCQINNI